MKPYLLLFLFLSMFNIVLARVNFNYDIESRKMQFDTQIDLNVDAVYGKGSNDIVITIEDSVGHPRCVIPSFGCTQYSMNMIDEGADIHLYVWPDFFYRIDCPCEDQPKIERDSTEFRFNIYIRFDSIYGDVHLEKDISMDDHRTYPAMSKVLKNPNSYVEDYLFYSLIKYYYRIGMSTSIILAFIKEFDNEVNHRENSEQVFNQYQYCRDFFLEFLPLLDKRLSLNDLTKLGEAIQRMISYQCW